MRRIMAILLVLAILFGAACPILAGAGYRNPSKKSSRAKKRDLEFERILRVLYTQRVSVDFNEVPFEEAIGFLRKVSKLNIVIDPKVYQETPKETMRVTLKLDNLPLITIFKVILRFWELRMVYKYGVLFITTKKEVQKKLVLRIYDVRDLIMPIRDFPGPDISLRNPEDTGPRIDYEFEEEREDSRIASPEELVNLIRQNIGGRTWEEVPGTSIEMRGGLLIVVQSREVHREIMIFLSQLRSLR